LQLTAANRFWSVLSFSLLAIAGFSGFSTFSAFSGTLSSASTSSGTSTTFLVFSGRPTFFGGGGVGASSTSISTSISKPNGKVGSDSPSSKSSAIASSTTFSFFLGGAFSLPRFVLGGIVFGAGA